MENSLSYVIFCSFCATTAHQQMIDMFLVKTQLGQNSVRVSDFSSQYSWINFKKNPLSELCEKENMQLGGGGVEGLWKINTSYSQIKPISDKKSWAVLTKKVGPFWTGPFRIWAVLSWAVSDLGRFDYNSPRVQFDQAQILFIMFKFHYGCRW